MAKSEIRVEALEVKQGERSLYTFAVDGKALPRFTTVSRVHRAEDRSLGGYQRSEAQAHIGSIKRYLETTNAILPNALVVAFDKRVRFKPADGRRKAKGAKSRVGEIVIPVDDEQPDEKKPGWIVDGQQRSAALREADIDGFPVFVTAFIAEDIAEQRSQFILVNSTKPLPKGLIYELLPGTPAEDLPVALLRRRYPAQLLERLNLDEDSPLQYRIKTPTIIDGVIKDNSVLMMLSASLEDGALYEHFDSLGGEGDTDAMLRMLKSYWAAVAECFPQAWEETPRKSRLVHGVGIGSMGTLMDEIVFCLGDDLIPSQAEFKEEIERITGACAWTEGEWGFGPQGTTGWNELQNTPGEIQTLTDHILGLYRAARAGKRVAQAA
jgi:DGQHR domain-containing protein